MAKHVRPPRRILICGEAPRKVKNTPGWTDYDFIFNKVKLLVVDNAVIIHGDAEGADKLGGRAGDECGLEVIAFPALWKFYGKAAGPIRNLEMLTEGKPTEIWAFHDNIAKSRGTADMIKIARKFRIPTLLFSHATPDGVIVRDVDFS